MGRTSVQAIHIASLTDDGRARLLLVGNAGNQCFMQAGDKFEAGARAI